MFYVDINYGSFQVPSREVDKSDGKFWSLWNKDTKEFFLQFAFKNAQGDKKGPPGIGAAGLGLAPPTPAAATLLPPPPPRPPVPTAAGLPPPPMPPAMPVGMVPPPPQFNPVPPPPPMM